MGVTHTNGFDKYEVSFVVVFMEEAMNVPFAVDVVERNDNVASIYYHDIFTVNVAFPDSSSSRKGRSGKGSKCKKVGKGKGSKIGRGGSRLLRE